MGACFVSGYYTETDKTKVEQKFLDDQEIDVYENGHCYSGSIGMANGIKFVDNLVFTNYSDADDWLSDNVQKWGPTLAVRLEDPDKKLTGWVYGALCSS